MTDDTDTGLSWVAMFRPPRTKPTDLNDDSTDLCECVFGPDQAIDVLIAMHRFRCPDWQAHRAP